MAKLNGKGRKGVFLANQKVLISNFICWKEIKAVNPPGKNEQ